MTAYKPRQCSPTHTLTQVKSKNAGKIFVKATQNMKAKSNIMASLPHDLIMRIVREVDGGRNTHEAKYKGVMSQFKGKVDWTIKRFGMPLYCDEMGGGIEAHDSTFEVREMGFETWTPEELWYNYGGINCVGEGMGLRTNSTWGLGSYVSGDWWNLVDTNQLTEQHVNWIYRVYNMDFSNQE